MASVAFIWNDRSYQLRLVQFREDRAIKPDVWWDEDEETKEIFAAREEKTGGTLLGCTNRGQVAFLVHGDPLALSLSNQTAELLPVKFLKGRMSPEEFAMDLTINKNLSSGLTFHMVVADLTSKSMFYISKRSPSDDPEIRPIGSGLYFMSASGLDSSPQANSQNDLLDEAFRNYRITRGHSFYSLINKLFYPKISGIIINGDEEYYGSTLVDMKRNAKYLFMKKERDDTQAHSIHFEP